MQRRIIPNVISGEQALCCLGPKATAREAALLMAERRVGVVMIMDQGQLRGIVSERDIVQRMVTVKGDPDKVLLEEIMTAKPDTIRPDDNAMTALEMMRAGGYRHLPVVADGELHGMVSIRDLYEAVRLSLEEDLKQTESFIHGEQYGAVSIE